MGRGDLCGRRTAAGAAMLLGLIALVVAGCGSGSNSASSVSGRPTAAGHSKPSPGVGMEAPISKVVVARRFRPWSGRPIGTETVGSMGCVKQEGGGTMGIYTDTPEPTCVQVTNRGTVLIVNRTSAYHRSEGKSVLVTLGPYRARIRPQQAVRFGPVGRFLGRGFHQARVDRGRLGVLIEPADCGISEAEPGEPLCFWRERAARFRRWRRSLAREHAPTCRGSALAVSVDHRTEDAAGTIYSKLDVFNRGRRSCNVAGVPRAVAVDRRGRPVANARPVPLLHPHSRPDHRRTWLRGGGGGGVSFTVTHSDGGQSGHCKLALTPGLRVTMPGTRHTLFVPLPISYCPPPHGGIALKVGRTE